MCPMVGPIPTVPIKEETRILSETNLLSEEKIHHLDVYTNNPLVIRILEHFQNCLDTEIFFFQLCRMTNRYSTICNFRVILK